MFFLAAVLCIGGLVAVHFASRSAISSADQRLSKVSDSLEKVDASLALEGEIKAVRVANKKFYVLAEAGILLASVLLLLLNVYALISYRRRMDEETAIRKDAERLRMAIRGTNDGIYDWDIKSQELYWSPQLKDLLGYNDAEIEASTETLDDLVHPDDRDQMWDAIRKYLSRDLPELTCIFRMRHKNGRWIWMHMRGKAIFDEDGAAQRLSGTYSDISRLKEYEERLEDAKTQAEKANAAKTEFLAHMSHEIRTPLTSISGVAEILLNQKKNLSEKQLQLVRVLYYSTVSLKELINDILDFSKIESGQLDLENKPFALGDLFQEVSDTLSVRAQEKGLAFSFNYKPLDGVVALGDKIRLRQILMNLIGNALKFTHEGFVDVTAVRKEYGGVPVMEISVKDSGIGIDKKNFSLIFERFRQADASVSRKYGGSGLGLSISRRLVNSMGGRMTLESEVGKGSNFTVTLPLHVAAGKQAGDSSGESGVGRSAGDVDDEKNRILLVEDYEGNIAVLSYILETMGYAFDIARTGLEAVNLWKEKRHNVILMDVQMPEMDGLTATRQIRKIEQERGLGRTPIIGMTAHAFVEDKDKCAEAGMDLYLAKPISESDLKAEISRYLDAREARRDGQASGAGR